MKLLGFVSTSLLVYVTSVAAFKNAAPLFIQANPSDKQILEQLTYVTKEESLPICSILTAQKNIILQIPDFSNEDLVHNKPILAGLSKLVESEFFQFTPFYKYNSQLPSDLSQCKKDQVVTVVTEVDNYENEEWLSVLSELKDENNENLIFTFPSLSKSLKLRSKELEKINHFVNLLASLIGDKQMFKLVVQGLPSSDRFDVTAKILNVVDNMMHSRSKRSSLESSNGDDVSVEELEQEVAETFKEIEEMIAQEGDDLAYIFDGSAKSNSTDLSGSGLLFKYQFFSPGIWMGTIVSFALLSILIILFQWLSTLNISYKSFDKPIDHQKKNQ